MLEKYKQDLKNIKFYLDFIYYYLLVLFFSFIYIFRVVFPYILAQASMVLLLVAYVTTALLAIIVI
jgi:hypothetical protein